MVQQHNRARFVLLQHRRAQGMCYPYLTLREPDANKEKRAAHTKSHVLPILLPLQLPTDEFKCDFHKCSNFADQAACDAGSQVRKGPLRREGQRLAVCTPLPRSTRLTAGSKRRGMLLVCARGEK